MKQHKGVWFPDGEVHMLEWCDKNGEMINGRTSYQIKKWRKALSYCRRFRTALDCGGHVGTWSMQMVRHFETVHAFEPVQAHRECFALNVPEANVVLHPCALGAQEGSVSIHSDHDSTGHSYIDGPGDIPLLRLDSFELQDVDFMKLDLEGAELFALLGGEATIKRCMPVVIVEQKPGRAQRFGLPETGAITYLESLGYRLAEQLSGDFIMVPKVAEREAA